jgi:hypothetical protein
MQVHTFVHLSISRYHALRTRRPAASAGALTQRPLDDSQTAHLAYEKAAEAFQQRQMNLQTDIRTHLLLALGHWGLRAEASGARPPGLDLTAISGHIDLDESRRGTSSHAHVNQPSAWMLRQWDAILTDHDQFRATIWPSELTNKRECIEPAGNGLDQLRVPEHLPDLDRHLTDARKALTWDKGLSLMLPEWLHQWTLTFASKRVSVELGRVPHKHHRMRVVRRDH